MALSRSAVTVAVLLVVLLVCRYCSAQSGPCYPSPPSSLNTIPVTFSSNGFFWQPTNTLRTQLGSSGINAWAVFSATQVQTYGLWCQVREQHNAGMGSNIGDWYYPTTGNTSDGFTLLPNTTDDNAPYQSLKCSNQIGLVVDGNVTNNQGIVRCSTTVPNLTVEALFFAVYSDDFINYFAGPIVDQNMTLSLLTSRDNDSNIMFTLSFIVSYGAPSYIRCTNNKNMNVTETRNPAPNVVREVIRSHYVSISQPDMTRVIVTQSTQREAITYTCNVTVEGRLGGTSTRVTLGTPKTSTVSITVAGTPTAVTANRTGFTSVLISWIAPSPAPAGYEVFYQAAGGSRLSGGNTSNTELTLSGLTLGETYSVFVVAFGPAGAPVFPSAHSNAVMIMINVPLLTVNPVLHPSISSIMVSWIPPQLTPSSYTISYSCQLLCATQQTPGTATVDGGVTTHNISSLNTGSSCTVSVTAVFGSNSSNTVTSSTNTTSAAPTGAPGGLNSTSVERRSLTVVWGTVPCPQQRGPITGYRLRYSSSSGSSSVNITGEESREYMLTGLTPYTSYSVQVAAVNDGGIGPYSEPALTVETLQEAPGPVSGVSASPGVVQLTISWTPPSEPNGFITDYEVGSNSSGGFIYTNTSDTQLTLRDIPPNTVVAFSVRAYTIIGPGDSVSGHASTSEVPRISSVSAVPLSSTAVNVSWTPVNLTSHSTVYYTVYYTIVNCSGEIGSGTVHFPVTVSSGVVSGLQEGQWYQFSISVTFNVNGQSFSGIPFSSQLIELLLPPTDPLPSSFFELSPTFSYPLQTSMMPLFSEPPAPSSSPTSTDLLMPSPPVLVVVSVILAISLLGNVITIVVIILLVRKLRYSHTSGKPSPVTISDTVYEQPELPTKSGDVEMVQCLAYTTTHHHQQQESNNDDVYETI